MNKSIAELDKQLEEFKKTIIQTNNYKSFASSLFQQLSIYEKTLEDNNITKRRNDENKNDWSTSVNFLYKDYSRGQTNSLELSSFTIDDSMLIRHELKNRLYQLLLLNTYEAFEKYLKSAGNHTNFEVKKDFSSTKFIKWLHEKIPVVSRIIKIRHENNSNFLDEVYLLLTFSIVEQLRHQIAHSYGYAKDKSTFIKECLKRIGRDNEGKAKSEYIDYLNIYFGNKEYENLICLIEIYDQKNPAFYYDRLSDLIVELASYVFFIHGHIKNFQAG